jgi:protein SCO1/2
MMQVFRPAVLVVTLAATLATPAFSHSLKELEQQLYDREKYFQPVDKEAPGFELQDADGRLVQMADFRSKVVVLHFIYTFCPDVCPLHAERIAEIQAMINQTPMKAQVQFITITTDPKRDTGNVLREYREAHGFDPSNWMFLTVQPGQPEDITRKLAKIYDLEFTRTEDGDQIHGVVTHVIDQNGRLRARFHGLNFNSTTLVIYVNGLVNDIHKPGEGGEAEQSFWERLLSWF